jgi:hypothetical protein
MLTFALALTLVAVTEVAVMTTLPVAEPAVKTVVAALAVPVGLNEPQVAAGLQLQVTPLFAESLATVAAMVAVPLGASDEGGGVLRVTVIAGAEETVMVGVLAVTLVSSTTVAMMTTLAAALGAV